MRVWAHWVHSLDVHLSYLGPVSCAFPSWVLSRSTVRGGYSSWRLGGRQPIYFHPEIPPGSPLGPMEVVDRLNGCSIFVRWYGRQHFFFFFLPTESTGKVTLALLLGYGKCPVNVCYYMIRSAVELLVVYFTTLQGSMTQTSHPPEDSAWVFLSPSSFPSSFSSFSWGHIFNKWHRNSHCRVWFLGTWNVSAALL